MRLIERIFVHCTASSQKWDVKELWDEFKRKGWTELVWYEKDLDKYIDKLI